MKMSFPPSLSGIYFFTIVADKKNMKMEQPNELKGRIERITYFDEESGFTVARLIADGYGKPVTVAGNLISPYPGETIRARGEWVRHPRFGDQFRIQSYEAVLPVTAEGVEKYLGSGLIRGIGPATAARIVLRFGKKALDILENDFGRLLEIDGIGEKRLATMRRSWDEQKGVRRLLAFLQEQGIGTAHAVKISRRYGEEAVRVLRENPYRLAADIFGIGFPTADAIAEKMGVKRDSARRIRAGILHVLGRGIEEGHVFLPERELFGKSRELLGVGDEHVSRELEVLKDEGEVRIEDKEGRPVYLAGLHAAECAVAARIRAIRAGRGPAGVKDTERSVKSALASLGLSPAEKQVEALLRAVREKILVITGGPGTGKTTLVRAVLELFRNAGARVRMAAPTGRAARRLSESTGGDASTIHRLLEYSVPRGGFQRDRGNPLDCDLLVVDEASMIDLLLMDNLLAAVRDRAAVIIVGDANQLPSVGPGNVLGDLIASEAVPVIELNEIFRQAGESAIILNAHRIRNGESPVFETGGDFFFIEREDPDEAVRTVLDLVGKRIPDKFGFDPVEDIQVLSPMNKGAAGTISLNAALQDLLNPAGQEIMRGARSFRRGDKVMQIRNNYDKEVFNGDIGRIVRIDPEEHELAISFDGREIPYDFAELEEIALAYAITIHKSQGSEYPAVVIPFLTQHYVLLQRNLLYTAVTRARSLVVLVGSRRALAMAVRNGRADGRFTGLKEKLAAVKN